MEIRNAEDRDIKPVAKLQMRLMEEHVQAGERSLAIAPGASGKWVRYIRKMVRGGRSVLLVAEDSGVIGYVFGYIKDQPPIFREKYVGYISDMYVLPAFRSRGVGQRLMAQAMDFFRAAGLPAVELHASVWNQSALSFYERLGFREQMKKLRAEL